MILILNCPNTASPVTSGIKNYTVCTPSSDYALWKNNNVLTDILLSYTLCSVPRNAAVFIKSAVEHTVTAPGIWKKEATEQCCEYLNTNTPHISRVKQVKAKYC